MGMFFPDDPQYDESVRLTGFNRYRQLMSIQFGTWWKVNLLTLLGFAPLAAGIFYAVASSSVLVLIPCSILGGAVAGPFLAGMYDAILRGLRDEPRPWWDCYKRSWKQNWKGSMALGALMGLLIGMYAFMGMLFWWAEIPPSPGTVLVYLFGLLIILMFNTLYWPQLVLFQQNPLIRLRNCCLFLLTWFWRVLGVGLFQLAYLAVYVFLAPWSLLLLPVIGVWHGLFLSQFFIYEQMDESFHIEALYSAQP